MAKTTPEVPNKLFYKIGEVCELTDTQPYVLRFWESEFPQLSPKKNRSGQRVYQRKDIDTVIRIKELLYEEEYTIAGARKKLEEEGSTGRKTAATRQKPVSRRSPRPSHQEAEHPVDALSQRSTRSRDKAEEAQPTTAVATAGRTEVLEKALAELKSSLKEVLALLKGA